MKKFYKAQEYIADHIDAVQYPKPMWQQNREGWQKLPWTTRVLLALFGVLILAFSFGFAALAGIFIYGAFS